MANQADDDGVLIEVSAWQIALRRVKHLGGAVLAPRISLAGDWKDHLEPVAIPLYRFQIALRGLRCGSQAAEGQRGGRDTWEALGWSLRSPEAEEIVHSEGLTPVFDLIN